MRDKANPLGKLEASLEEAFFSKQNAEALAALRAKLPKTTTPTAAALSEASGVKETGLMDALARLGMQPETVAALSLVPLVMVAWSDDELDANEQQAVLRAATDAGITPESAPYGILKTWLTARPGAEVFDAWTAYVRDLRRRLDATAMQQLEEEVLGRARRVAASAGGFLGVGAISPLEELTLGRLKSVFHDA